MVLVGSVCLAFLFLLGCFALLWCIYKKTKSTFSPGTSLPQHLKEVGRMVAQTWTGKPDWEELSCEGRAGASAQPVLPESDTHLTRSSIPGAPAGHLWSLNSPEGGGKGLFPKSSSLDLVPLLPSPPEAQAMRAQQWWRWGRRRQGRAQSGGGEGERKLG